MDIRTRRRFYKWSYYTFILSLSCLRLQTNGKSTVDEEIRKLSCSTCFEIKFHRRNFFLGSDLHQRDRKVKIEKKFRMNLTTWLIRSATLMANPQHHFYFSTQWTFNSQLPRLIPYCSWVTFQSSRHELITFVGNSIASSPIRPKHLCCGLSLRGGSTA